MYYTYRTPINVKITRNGLKFWLQRTPTRETEVTPSSEKNTSEGSREEDVGGVESRVFLLHRLHFIFNVKPVEILHIPLTMLEKWWLGSEYILIYIWFWSFKYNKIGHIYIRELSKASMAQQIMGYFFIVSKEYSRYSAEIPSQMI